MKRNKLILILLLLIIAFVPLNRCTFPFTTASYKWKIKFDKEKLEYKEDSCRRSFPNIRK